MSDNTYYEPQATPVNTENAAFASPLPVQDGTWVDYYTPVPETPKKRKAWPWLVSGIVLLLAALAALYFFVLRKEESEATPREKLASAITATLEELPTLIENTENLQAYRKQLSAMSFEQFSYGFTLDLSGEEEITISLSTNGNLDTSVGVEGALDLLLTVDGNSLPLTVNYSVDNENIILGLPDYLPDVYRIPIDELGLDEASSVEPSESGMGIPDASELAELEQQLTESMAIASVEEKEYELGNIKQGVSKLVPCEVYHITYDATRIAQTMQEIFGDFTTQLAELAQGNAATLESLEILSDYFVAENYKDMRAIVYDGKWVGYEMDIELADTLETISVMFKGENSPWEYIEMVMPEYETIVIELAKTDTGLTAGIAVEDKTLSLRYNDEAKELLLYQDKTLLCRLSYDTIGSEMKGTLEVADGEETLTLTVLLDKLQDAPEALSENAVDLLSLDEEELQELLTDIIMQLATDPETAWVFGALN